MVFSANGKLKMSDHHCAGYNLIARSGNLTSGFWSTADCCNFTAKNILNRIKKNVWECF